MIVQRATNLKKTQMTEHVVAPHLKTMVSGEKTTMTVAESPNDAELTFKTPS